MLNCYCQGCNCQVQLFLDNMVLANQDAKLTGADQGFSCFPCPHTRALGTRLANIYLFIYLTLPINIKTQKIHIWTMARNTLQLTPITAALTL
jgi:hypothetical protein